MFCLFLNIQLILKKKHFSSTFFCKILFVALFIDICSSMNNDNVFFPTSILKKFHQSTVSKLNNDLQAMRMKYEAELTARAEEFEDMKRKLSIQLQETEEAYNGAMAKVSNLEKVRIRMASEIDALAADLDNVREDD